MVGGEAWVSGKQVPVAEWLTVGKELGREFSEIVGIANPGAFSDEHTARLTELVGERTARLPNSRIGVIGCSGIGSPAVHVLVRAGVRRFVLVDPEVFAPSNLERMHGSRWRDLKTKLPKVEIVRRLIWE